MEKNGCAYAVSIYRQIAKFAKDCSFIDEDEIRLYHESLSIKETVRLIDSMASVLEVELYKNTRKNFLELVKQLNIETEQFYISSKGGIRGYKDFCLEEVWGSGVIPEIILGPMCMQNRNEIKRFLKQNGLEGTNVSVSTVPIR